MGLVIKDEATGTLFEWNSVMSQLRVDHRKDGAVFAVWQLENGDCVHVIKRNVQVAEARHIPVKAAESEAFSGGDAWMNYMENLLVAAYAREKHEKGRPPEEITHTLKFYMAPGKVSEHHRQQIVLHLRGLRTVLEANNAVL